MFKNPLMGLDYPDVDVIRVEDTYYMVSTTMYFMPGCVILRSYDLANWEIAGYVYETLEETPGHRLAGEQNIYGQGMWAASLRYHKGTFYICFVANDTHKTYLFQSESVEGPWRKQNIEGFYHDAALFFDEDDRVYIIAGNSAIWLTELKSDLTGPKEGGIRRIIVEDKDHPSLGYEGTHFYKINGRYYAFFIHSLRTEWFRTEACFSSDSLLGEFTGGDILQDDMGFRHSGVAQGGIVDTPDGKWYALLFQDRGAVGRIPVLVPLHWEGHAPVLGINGRVPLQLEVTSTRPDYHYEPLSASDDFDYKPSEDGEIHLKKVWQWNHNPHKELWSVTERPKALRLHSGKICENLTQSYNTLTQRTGEPESAAWVTVDGSGLKDGDYAGITALQGCYGAVALTRDKGEYALVMVGKSSPETSMTEEYGHTLPEKEYERIPVDSPVVTLKCRTDYREERDEAEFYYEKAGKWIPIGSSHKLTFKLDHFTGCRFGLFYYSTKETGGISDFLKFHYETDKAAEPVDA